MEASGQLGQYTVEGQVQRMLINPYGEVDGLRLSDGTIAKFAPHMADALTAMVKPGDRVRIIGAAGLLTALVPGSMILITAATICAQNIYRALVPTANVPRKGVIDGIDMLAARQLLSGDHGLFMGLLERFLRDTASLPGELPAWSRDPAADRRQALLARLRKHFKLVTHIRAQ